MSNLRERKILKSKKGKDTGQIQNDEDVHDTVEVEDAVEKPEIEKSSAIKEKSTKKQKKTKSKYESESTEQRGSFLYKTFGKLKYVFLLIFVPPFLNYASLQREQNELRPIGELYDIGWTQRLFLSCQGQGSPTIILDAPTGFTSDVWSTVAVKLSLMARVCVYDRAGLGFSDRPMNSSAGQSSKSAASGVNHKWQPFTLERMMDDIHKLLTSSSQQPLPLILVGAELGAIVAQGYATVYDSSVLGLVLINPLPDDLFNDPVWTRHWFSSSLPMHQSLQLSAALGLNRLALLAGLLTQPLSGSLVSPEVITRQKHLLCHPRHLSSVVDEHYFINQTLSQLKTLRTMRRIASNITVSVLTGNYYDEQMPQHLNKAWARAEQSLLSRHLPQAKHSVVNGADRHMMYRNPEPIIEAVTKIIRKWKKSQASQPQSS